MLIFSLLSIFKKGEKLVPIDQVAKSKLGKQIGIFFSIYALTQIVCFCKSSKGGDCCSYNNPFRLFWLICKNIQLLNFTISFSFERYAGSSQVELHYGKLGLKKSWRLYQDTSCKIRSLVK